MTQVPPEQPDQLEAAIAVVHNALRFSHNKELPALDQQQQNQQAFAILVERARSAPKPAGNGAGSVTQLQVPDGETSERVPGRPKSPRGKTPSGSD